MEGFQSAPLASEGDACPLGKPRLPLDRVDHEGMRALARALDDRGHAYSEFF
jgi:hypothetical protein